MSNCKTEFARRMNLLRKQYDTAKNNMKKEDLQFQAFRRNEAAITRKEKKANHHLAYEKEE